MGIFNIISGVIKNKDEILSFANERGYQREKERILEYGIEEWIENWMPSSYCLNTNFSAVDEIQIQVVLDIVENGDLRDKFITRLYDAGYNLDNFLDSEEIKRLTGRDTSFEEEAEIPASDSENNVKKEINSTDEITDFYSQDIIDNIYNKGVTIRNMRPRITYKQYEIDNFETKSEFETALKAAENKSFMGVYLNGMDKFNQVYNELRIFWNKETINNKRNNLAHGKKVVGTFDDGTVEMTFYDPTEEPKKDDLPIGDYVLGSILVDLKYTDVNGLATKSCDVYMRGGGGSLYDKNAVKRAFGGHGGKYITCDTSREITFSRSDTTCKKITCFLDEKGICNKFLFEFHPE